MIFNSLKTTQPNPDFYFRLECDHLNIQFIPLCNQNGFRLFKRGTRKQWQVFRQRVRFENSFYLVQAFLIRLWKYSDRMCAESAAPNTTISKLWPVADFNLIWDKHWFWSALQMVSRIFWHSCNSSKLFTFTVFSHFWTNVQFVFFLNCSKWMKFIEKIGGNKIGGLMSRTW